LTEKQKKFAEIIAELRGRISGTEAAIRAGYERGSAYQRSFELQNPEICPHVVKYINEIRKDISTKYEISKDNHMEELWNIREDARKKDNQMVRLRAEEDRGRLMGYYIEKKAILNANKTLDDLSLEELWDKARGIEKKYRHFKEDKKDEKKEKPS
tara:strand:+ start:308 stop:775 length:468 start_codon:yes stop_codon:yes gene_type:complete